MLPVRVAVSVKMKVSAPFPPLMAKVCAPVMVKVSLSLPPWRVSKLVKSKILDIDQALVTSDQVLGKLAPVRVSSPLPARMVLMLSNPLPKPVAVPAKPSTLPTEVKRMSQPVV